MSDSSQIIVFDRRLVRQRHAKAERRPAEHGVLSGEGADGLMDRLMDVRRGFDSALGIGAHMAERLAAHGVPFVVNSHQRGVSPSPLLEGERGWGEGNVKKDTPHQVPPASKLSLPNPQYDIIFDEELLPFAPKSFDLIVSNLTMHWINDLPGALAQSHDALRGGGLFLAALPGGDTLRELRDCLMEAELSLTGGVSPRLSPTVDLATAGALLQRAGFQLPVADRETITLVYPDMFALMRDLRDMGETNAHIHRIKHPTRRSVMTEAARLYAERYPAENGGIAATFEMIFLHGWKEDYCPASTVTPVKAGVPCV